MRAFTADILKYRCTAVQYIGELCRYLLNAPPNAEDDKLNIQYAIGNGLRPDVWGKFQVLDYGCIFFVADRLSRT